MVAEFQAGAGAPLLLVSLQAGGTGLNLTAASQVIHYDRWWNPAVEDQATDRAWRLGQQRTVNVHKLVCQGTVEERIGEVIDEKRALADAVVGTGEAWLSELSTDDLARLVMLEDEHERAQRATSLRRVCSLVHRRRTTASGHRQAVHPVKPRKPYGANPPGRLPATMIKVLAAELSDQGRLSRGKRYWAEDAVVDIVVGHGAVTAVIQGSRPDPYVVTIEATQGTGVPSKREVWISCTCPDDGDRDRGMQARRGGPVRIVRRGRDRARAARTLAQSGSATRGVPRPNPVSPRSCRSGRDDTARPCRARPRAAAASDRPATRSPRSSAMLLGAPNGGDVARVPGGDPARAHRHPRPRSWPRCSTTRSHHLEINWE